VPKLSLSKLKYMNYKKTLLIVLLFASLCTQAQRKRVLFNNTPAITNSMVTFNTQMNNFMYMHRLRIAAGNRAMVDIRLSYIKYLPAVMNLDSLLLAVWTDLQPLKDSFPDDLNCRRIDYHAAPGGKARIRLLNHKPMGTSFVKEANGLSFLKMEQDTLHIIGYIAEEKPYEYFKGFDMIQVNRTDRGTYINYMPYEIFVTVNNLSGFPQLLNNTLNGYMKDIAANYQKITGHNAKKDWQQKVNLQYEPLSSYKGLDQYVVYRKQGSKYVFIPVAQAGIQNIRSSFVPYASAGLSITNISYDDVGKEFALLWEPFFFFDKNGNGKTVIQRNDFITFSFKEQWKRPAGKEVSLSNTFSVGYLLNRDGEYFNKNTFKIAFPGMQFRNLLLQPQFIFNDLFKQFYPSVRMQVRME
jgi:hypothetical protein